MKHCLRPCAMAQDEYLPNATCFCWCRTVVFWLPILSTVVPHYLFSRHFPMTLCGWCDSSAKRFSYKHSRLFATPICFQFPTSNRVFDNNKSDNIRFKGKYFYSNKSCITEQNFLHYRYTEVRDISRNLIAKRNRGSQSAQK